MATVLAIDLGTSRVKVGLLDERLGLLGAAAAPYPSARDGSGRAEQRVEDWLAGLARAAREALSLSDAAPDAVVLTAQMPTLVALGDDLEPRGPAVTWQDGRADALVLARLDDSARARVEEVSGAPLDGRYLAPMEWRRRADGEPAAARLASAKDFLFSRLTGDLATDPSTASGFGAFDLAAGGWSEELLGLWGLEATALPAVAPSDHTAPLSARGAELLGVAAGVPVFLGGADSVCAHHYVGALYPGAVSVIDGSSTVVLATLEGPRPPRVLVTPLVTPGALGAEMDLLATGASLAWLAELLGVGAGTIEGLALAPPGPASAPVTFRPYLAGGEQGALWRSDLAGSIEGLALTTTRADLARALYEGIAFETLRCLAALSPYTPVTRVVALTSPKSRSLGPALLAGAGGIEVTAIGEHSPSLLGAGVVALSALGVATGELEAPEPSVLPELGDPAGLAARAARYLEAPVRGEGS